MGISTPSTGGGAPTDAAYVTGSSNSELSNETVVSPAGDILTSGSFGSTVSVQSGFGTFRQVDADNPSILYGEVAVQTDGNSDADVKVAVDESGGTTATYTIQAAFINSSHGGNSVSVVQFSLPLPAGAQFKLINTSDPQGNNSVNKLRAVVITP